ncbi:pectinesterase family protein [Catenovulum sp. 2E275]|uniref:pectinesterase family protein n=1 Tax=Catenovulum sp. 2E275 TaxID=2980497 RepID=UPI0021D355A7|nr:pectinesterase family protein [Catenovulum sp. 2E275]MCU4675313.1 pectinesterase family protein [Catenovulum sp. 2E275]
MFEKNYCFKFIPFLYFVWALSGCSQLPSKADSNYQLVNLDHVVRIQFDSKVKLNKQGVVTIYDGLTNQKIETITPGLNKQKVGLPFSRKVNQQQIYLQENTLFIELNDMLFEYGQSYYVHISSNLVSGVLNGQPFTGIRDKSLAFKIKPQPKYKAKMVVDSSGVADFTTVQGALNYMMALQNTAPKHIEIKNGDYHEILYLKGVSNLTISGQDQQQTQVYYTNNDGLNPGASNRALFLIEDSDQINLMNFTVKNTHLRTGKGDQAEALYFNSETGRLTAKNMTFVSEQDTILVKGYNWFYHSKIVGNVDFIWGYSQATLFEDCEIQTIADTKVYPKDSQGGYVLQARTPDKNAVGFVFLNSRFTSAQGALGNQVLPQSTFIARSAGSDKLFDNITLINAQLGEHIAPQAWLAKKTPNPSYANALTGWKEYGSTDLTGEPIDYSFRSQHAKQLSYSEAQQYMDKAFIFKSFNNGSGWIP